MNKLPFEGITRNIIVKREAETSEKFGILPENRPIADMISYGIININKPAGPTSHQISAYVQQILGITKAGHSGTLDPNVTGVLPTALGRATRIVHNLLNAGKEYVCLMYLHQDVDEKKIRDVCNEFIGKITQLPPIKSAVKRQWRERTIYYLEILEIDGRNVLFRVGCQAGTYIRKLVHDMGIKMGTKAHMAELVRTKVAGFDDTNWHSLQDLTDAYYVYKQEGNEKLLKQIIFPIEVAVGHLPKIWVFDTTVDSLCHGSSLKTPGISKLESGIEKDDTVVIMTLKNELIGVGKATTGSNEIARNNRGIACTIDQVFMLPGTYPRIEKKEES